MFAYHFADILDAVSLVTISTSKLFSGGLDLSFIKAIEPEDFQFFVLEVARLFGRLLAFNCPTLCLVKGAAYAAGCIFAFSHD
jgi:enoyl-CoA hydratase/carnithine racemase